MKRPLKTDQKMIGGILKAKELINWMNRGHTKVKKGVFNLHLKISAQMQKFSDPQVSFSTGEDTRLFFQAWNVFNKCSFKATKLLFYDIFRSKNGKLFILRSSLQFFFIATKVKQSLGEERGNNFILKRLDTFREITWTRLNHEIQTWIQLFFYGIKNPVNQILNKYRSICSFSLLFCILKLKKKRTTLCFRSHHRDTKPCKEWANKWIQTNMFTALSMAPDQSEL